MIKAVLIDLDGLLINSESLYFEANKIYFKQYNFKFTEELHHQGTGKKFALWIKTVTNINKTGEEILKERNKIFFKFVKQKLKLMPGVDIFLKTVKRYYHTAMVTSSKKDYIKLVFSLVKINKYFDLIVSGEDVGKGKPDPECYLLAAKKFGVKPCECLVVEDAPNGVMAGLNAGMKILAIPSLYVKKDPIFKKADILLKSFKEFRLSIIKIL